MSKGKFRSLSLHRPRPARPSALLLALLRRARWWWLSWLEARWQALKQWRAQRRESPTDRPLFETLEPKLLLSADLLPAGQTLVPVIERVVDSAPASAELASASTDITIQAYDWKSHKLLSGVDISPAQGPTVTTDAQGSTLLSAVSGITTTLSAARAVPAAEADATGQAVNLQDAIAVLKMVVGLDVNGAGKPLSPYQAIAADFDGNGAVELSDAIGVLKNVVGLPVAAGPRWAFVDEADTTVPAKAGLNPGVIAATTTLTVEPTAGLVGVLRGDVDGSWVAPSGTPQLGSDHFNALITKVNEREGAVKLTGEPWGIRPSLLRLNLEAASDTGVRGDFETSLDSVTLVGQTQAGVDLSLKAGGSIVATTQSDAQGAFSFAGLALAQGANSFELVLEDATQSISTNSVQVVRIGGSGDVTPPLVTAALASDTGAVTDDGITTNPAVSGRATDAVGATVLRAVLDPVGASPTFSDLSGLLQADGRFTIDAAQMASLAGGTLADGAHVLRLVALDAAGNASAPLDLAFTLDTAAPGGTTFALSSADALDGNTRQTAAALATLRGQASPGATLALASQGLSATASASGEFQLPGVALAVGDNTLTLQVTDLAGNIASSSTMLTRVVQTRADAVLDWNATMLRSIQRDVTDVPLATRLLAMQSVAVYDVLAAIQGTPAYMVQRSVSGAVSADAAVVTAAHRILWLTYPGQRTALDQAKTTSLAAITDGAAKLAGEALGLDIANAVYASRQGDGSTSFLDYTGSTAVGSWRPTGPMFDVADNPNWKNVTPFALASPDEFRAPPPPAVDSVDYALAIEEVRRVGSDTSTTRSADQTQQALFWADGTGSYTPPGHWNQIAAQVAAAEGNSLSANARLFAQLNVALADAAIACWDTKYTYGFWRPETAIQNADIDNNGGTTQDSNWRPLLITPPHPDYVSGHSTFSAAAAAVLGATFGDATAFITDSVTLPGVNRSFTSFSQAAEEAGASRIYGGIHTSHANLQGATMGAKVGAAVLERFALSQDQQAPNVVAANTAQATNANLVLTGQVLDNLSGVASAQYRVDNGALQDLALGADGGFSVTTALALDGTADGSHSVTVIARDAAGNISPGVTRSFTLDTVVPTLALTSLAAGDTLTTSSRLTGTASPTGTALTQLSFRFDNGTARSLVFDASTGAFDQPLVIGGLDIGDHALAVTARDAAGNTTTLTRTVTVAALTPLRISSFTPDNGASDVGVTQRPQITFTRAVNAATLTASSFYATGPGGAVLPATIVPALDGSFAWLFFNDPMPGGSQITLHVDGSKIRAAADGAFLDADGDGTAGGELSASFTTVSTTAVAGTKLVGKVVDPGPDLLPMTFDDIRRGPDGVIHTPDDVFLNPIAHAKVYVLGQEDKFVFTDANGNFELTDVPVGEVKLAIDGRTSTNPPSGVFFPEMVMAVQLQPGITNTLMGSMGSNEERLANADRREVYLPRVASSVLQDVSDTSVTTITVDATAAPNLTDAQRNSMTLTVNPGSAIGENGQPLANAQIGISTVPPELVRDMLPPGILQHTFDITIQAPGVATFAEPVQITFPNVFNAEPGTKLSVLSFDHTTGMLVINGTATVSADGLTVVSDPDSGIRAPGWHGVTPPVVCGDGGSPPPPPPPPPTPADTENEGAPVVNPLLFGQSGTLSTLTWKAPEKLPETPPPPPPDPNCPTPPRPEDPAGKKQPYITVTIDVDGPLADFMKKSGNLELVSQSFTLTAGSGETKTFGGSAKSYAEIFGGAAPLSAVESNTLYGSKITVTTVTGKPDGSKHTEKASYFLYRFVDATDADHEDKQIEFEDSLVGVTRTKPIDVKAGGATPTMSASGVFSVAGTSVQFAPTTTALDQSGTLTIKAPGGQDVGTVALKGDGQAKQTWKIDIDTIFNPDDFTDALENAFDNDMTAAEKAFFGTANAAGTLEWDAAKGLTFANEVVAEAESLLSAFSAGITRVTSSDSTTVLFDDLEKDFFEGSGGELGTAFIVDNNSGSYSTSDIRANRATYSSAEENFRLSEALNETLSGHVDIYVDQYFQQNTPDWTRADLKSSLGKTIAHELGHNVGLNHTNKFDGSDVMAQGFVFGAQRAFGTTTNAMKIAVAMGWNSAEAQQAVQYYVTYIDLGGGEAHVHDAVAGTTDPDSATFADIGDGLIALFEAASGLSVDAVDFGDQDLAAGAVTRQLLLSNFGDEAAVISAIRVEGGGGQFSHQLAAGPMTLQPGERRALDIRFDPTATGASDAKLVVESDALHPVAEFRLTGFGRTQAPTAHVQMRDNNLDGVAADAGERQRALVGTITNHGVEPLVISGLSLAEGGSSFELLGVPANLAASPITLAFGESFSFGAAFDPDSVGLQRALIQLTSNAAPAPAVVGSLVGTGLDGVVYPQWGEDYVAITTAGVAGENTLRTVSDTSGRFSFQLPAMTGYHLAVFDPVTGLVSHGYGQTAVAGSGTDLTRNLVFGGSRADDSDFDGLPDDIEQAIGSNAASRDTDKDGLDDFTEISQGLDPLGGLGIPVGVVSVAPVTGTAEAVTVIGATDGSSRPTALVATGTAGLAIVDAGQLTRPKVLAEIDLPGDSTDVAADTVRQLAVVAGGSAGLHIVDIADLSTPVLEMTVAFTDAASRVEVRDGIAYVATGRSLALVDLNTGDVRQTLDLGGAMLTDLAIDGDTLYTMDSARTLRAITVSGDLLTVRDSLGLASGGGRLFVGGGVAYVGTTDSFAQGYATVDVRDPADLKLLSAVDATTTAGQALAANGSGLVIGVGSLRGATGQQIFALDVSSGADTTNTGAFLTRVALPAAPQDLALANGMAFVADGIGGLQIINYVGFDTQGLAPVVTIAVDSVDADPNTVGVQVLEGRSLRVRPTITDDVQVRNVELLVNGQAVSNDVSFPFELFTLVPPIDNPGGADRTSITLQVRATDTGGNVAVSSAVTLAVVPDTFPPNITSINLVDAARLFFVRSIDIGFDEPIDVGRLAASGVTLLRAGADGLFDTGDDVAYPFHLDTRSLGQAMSVVVDAVLPAGEYRFRLDPAIVADRAGNALTAAIERHFTIRPASDVRAASGVPEIPTAPSANPGQQIGIGVPFDPLTAKAAFQVIDGNGTVSTRVVNVLRTDVARGVAYFQVPIDALTGDAVVYSLVGSVRTDFADGTFLLQIVPTISGVQIDYLDGEGGARLRITGTGFVEGANSEYRFGSEVVADPLTTTGPDATPGTVFLTLPLSDGAFGPISVKTAGGSSAAFTVGLTGIESVAFSGTPADANQASANAGQAVTLRGSGLSTTTDVLLRYVDSNGTLQQVQLSPQTAAADGSSATLDLPANANGAFALQVLGSSSQPLLQIVPTLGSFNQQTGLYLNGSGLVENGSSYSFAGANVTDANANVDVDVQYSTADNRTVYLDTTALPNHGLGPVSVTTAGGTSAPLALNTVALAALGSSLGDVAIDPVSGALWTSDYTNPGHLLRIDPASGAALQSIELSSAFGTTYTYNHAGLQVVPSAFTLGVSSVPVGSLLVFNGYANPDRVVAVNPADGSVIASLSLQPNAALGLGSGAYFLTAGLYDPTSGHLFVTEHNSSSGNRLLEIDPATGVPVAVVSTPLNVQSWAGLAIDPVSGNLWLGSSSGGAQLVEITRAGTEVRRISTASQGLDDGEISGLAFAPDGKLWVASTQGVIYRIDTHADPVAVASATLIQVLASASDGVAANAALPAANVGQVIELRGTNFGAGTMVLFNTRDNAGSTGLASVAPLAINAEGTRLQVRVPDLASSGDVRVVNRGASDAGGQYYYNDSVYRQVTLQFTAGSSDAVIRFADGGLQDIGDESWGIDNVSVKRGDSIVFSDNFEAGAKPQWSSAAIDVANPATLSRFSGRFGNGTGGQTLNLGGLSAGQTYTLAFDLYVLDSWDGDSPGNGPDLFDVSVDGISLLRETLSNYAGAQTLNASAGIALQVVPTLTGISSGRPGEDDQFTLNGSGFMEGASTLTIGGVVLSDTATNLTPFDVSGNRNNTMTVVAPRTLDGPIRITTEGGFAQIAAGFGTQPVSVFTAISASASAGVPTSAAIASAVTGQAITLTGQGFTSSTLVQFQGIDDTGALGTLTRTGSMSNNGTTLTVVVPALARTGAVTVLGSGTAIDLQIVPTLRAVGGTVAAGNTIVLEGTGLTSNDLVITIDGRTVGAFTRRTTVDGTNANNPDQQLITLTVPNGASNAVIGVATAGGQSGLRAGVTLATQDALTPAADVPDTMPAALDAVLARDSRITINGIIGTGTATSNDVDLYRVDLGARDVLRIGLASTDLNSRVRVFDAAGAQVNFTTFGFNDTDILEVNAPAVASTYYVGVGGSNNSSYNPASTGSGTNADAGSYSLTLESLRGGTNRLLSIDASATSGTPANGSVASANVGQAIVIRGSGFVAGSQVQFTTLDASGNLGETTVTPTVDLSNQTLTVTVPDGATTGRVRIEGERTGLLLQIVPTVASLQMGAGNFTGRTLTVNGSGFAEGNIEVLLGTVRIGDTSPNSGINVFNSSRTNGTLTLTVANGSATGPVTVTTVGGTSATFSNSFTGIDAVVANGAPANPAQASALARQMIRLTGSGFDLATEVVFQTVEADGSRGDRVVLATLVEADGSALTVRVPENAVTGDVRVLGSANAIALQIVPTISDVQVDYLSGDGMARVRIVGSGFVEGSNTEYRFGSQVILDAGNSTDPEVYSDTVYLTLPLSDGDFGPISVKTAGGSSAAFTLGLTGIESVAFSGTPADASQASANAGQAITLRGSGLSTTTDVLLRYVDSDGTLQRVQLSPQAAAADGSSATLDLPAYANGAFALQVLGSSSQPLLQIVPTLTRFDQQDRLVLYGSGFVEGATRYSFTGATVVDNAAQGNNIDVYYDGDQNRSAYLNRTALPSHGQGPVTISTAGGTSAALALPITQVPLAGIDYLSDVTIDPVSGAVWIIGYANPGLLQRIDPTSGAVLQTITLSDAFGSTTTYNYAGLQVNPTAFMLGATTVPARSLLVFNGLTSPDRVIAVNPADGSVIASLVLAGNHALTAGVFDAASGHLFVTEHNVVGNRLLEIDPGSGALIAALTTPLNVQSWAGLAIDPVSGNLWLGSSNGGANLVEITRAGVEVRRIATTNQGLDQGEISGLAFAPDGKLWVSSTQGVIYRIDTHADPVAVASATLTQVLASASDGVAANAALPAANVGQVIELRGTNFGAGTMVLFNTRDNAGSTGLASVAPLAINAEGTRLQVRVPDLASSGDVRVVNRGASDAGGQYYYNDSVYRQVTLQFTAGSSDAVIRFADGGLQDIGDESWGIDNVSVKRGDSIVFSDNFEAGAKPQWSSAAIDAANPATLSRFSGRFGNGTGGQTLNLGGLSAGQTYALAFDLYVLDSWDGDSPGNGPDLFDVSVDGISLLRETLSNYAGAQTLNASAGIALQVVPTLTGISSGRPGEDDQFTLNGSGFMEGASTLTVGGVVLSDTATNLTPFDVSGNRNNTMTVVAPRTLDGPIRITTEGGFAQIAAGFGTQPVSVFTAISASASAGVPTSAAIASAVTGQAITLTGQGFTSSTLVQFQGIDDTGALGTLTRTGSMSNNGTTLTVVVPALARTGAVTVLGSGTAIDLQIVPTLRAVGGTVAAGNTIVLEGTGLTSNDLVITIDGRTVGAFARRTTVDGTNANRPDQQLITLTVPDNVASSAISVTTAGGSFALQSSLTSIAAAAASGSAAQIGVASANAGQAIVIHGSGIVAGARLVFTTLDTSGNLVDLAVIPTVDVANQTLSVTVPDAATTGGVRLQTETGGLLLQIVPTISGATLPAGGFIGATLTLSGSGFAEGLLQVSMGSTTTIDRSRLAGPDVTNTGRINGSLSLTVPQGAGPGPLTVTTIGGSSNPFSVAFTGVNAIASSGVAADAAKASAVTGQTITVIGTGLSTASRVIFETIDRNGTRDDIVVLPTSVNAAGTEAQVVVPMDAVSADVRVLGSAAAFALQVVPTITDVQIESIYQGVTTVLLSGSGFVEGGNTEYRFGSLTIVDAGSGSGVDVYDRFDPVLGATIRNGQARLAVPTSDAIFGAISVKSAGGTSAIYLENLTGITAVAASGTPADPTAASANAGQTVTLLGSRLSTATDVLMSYVDTEGTLQMVQVNPSAAAADGSSATLLVPAYANGVYTLRVLGSSTQPLLQIVPTLTRFDQQDRLVLYGSGFVEGATRYSFTGATVVDNAAQGNNIDVYYDGDQNRSAYLNRTALPSHGQGPVTISTAGGTSAALALPITQVPLAGIDYLSDVTIDPVSGAVWIIGYANPGLLQRIDPTSGAVLQTITLSDAFGSTTTYNYAGLQVNPTAFMLGATTVPARSLLVFNGLTSPDRVIAVNPADGSVIASLSLQPNAALGLGSGAYLLTAGLYDATTGHLFVTEHNSSSGNRLLEIDPATGVPVAVVSTPLNVQSWAGLAIDPVSGNLWLGSSSGGANLVEITRAGVEVRRIATTSQGLDQGEISGLAFAPDGALWVSSTQGVIYRIVT